MVKKKNATCTQRKAGQPVGTHTAKHMFLTVKIIKSISAPQDLSKSSFTQRIKKFISLALQKF
jgi:hypothetical protein